MSAVLGRPTDPPETQRLYLGVAVWCSVGIVSAVLLVRRLSGGFQNSLSDGSACLVTVIAIVISLLGYSLIRKSSSAIDGQRWWIVVSALLVIVPPIVLGLALMPEGSTVGLALQFSVCLLAAVFYVAVSGVDLWAWKRGGSAPARDRMDISSDSLMDDEEFRDEEDAFDADGLVCQFARQHTPDGQDVLIGTHFVKLAPGQKQEVLHLPFSPAFEVTPDVSCEALDAEGVRVKAASVQPYGARLEIRRSGQTDSETTAQIQVFISAPCRSDRVFD